MGMAGQVLQVGSEAQWGAPEQKQWGASPDTQEDTVHGHTPFTLGDLPVRAKH